MNGIRVALVEDDENFARAVAVLFQNSPRFEWLGSWRSMAEALREAPGQKPKVLLVDLDLPDGSGEDCIRRLAESAPMVRPIVLSKFESPDRIFRAIRAGAFGYALKADGMLSLVEVVEAVADGQAGMTPSVARRAFEVLREQGPTGLEAPAVPTVDEEELLELVKQGLSNKEIADRLSLGPQTVANKLTAIYKKLHMTRDGRKVLRREQA